MYIIARTSLRGTRQFLTPRGFISETLIKRLDLKVVTYDLQCGYDVITKLMKSCVREDMKKSYRLVSLEV